MQPPYQRWAPGSVRGPTPSTRLPPHVLVAGARYPSVESLDTLIAGADKIAINSAAVGDPALITRGAERFGSQCIVVAIDARWEPEENAYRIYVSGGRKPVGLDAIEWAREVEARGAGEILLTSMDCDGTKDGYELKLTRAIADAVSIPVIASGGAGKMEHFADPRSGSEAFRRTNITEFPAAHLSPPRRSLVSAGCHGRASEHATGKSRKKRA